MTGKELAVRRWAMKVGRTVDERAVLFGLAYECNGVGTIAEIRAGARAYDKRTEAEKEAETGASTKPSRPIATRPALRSLQQSGQVQFLTNGQWRAV